MKRFRRILAWMLSLMMLFMSLRAGFAEEPLPTIQVESIAASAAEPASEPVIEPAPESLDVPTEAPSAEPFNEPSAEPSAEAEPTQTATSVEPSIEPSVEPSSEPSPEPSAEASADPTAEPSAQTAADQPEFSCGYACLLEKAPAYADAALTAEKLYDLHDGVFYVSDRRSTSAYDRLEVRFDDGAAEAVAWVDAQCLRPMDEAESSAFIAAHSSPNTRYCSLNSALPLDAAAYTSSPSATTTAHVTVEPSITHSATPAAIPSVEPTTELTTEPTAEPSALPSADPNADPAPKEDEMPPSDPTMLVEQTELRIGLKEKRAIIVRFSDGEDHAVTFSSDRSKYASVDENGLVTGNKRGKTVIRVRSEFDEEISVPVSVVKAPKSIKLSAARQQLGVGEGLQLTARLDSSYASALQYESDHPEVAQVDANGYVRALSEGSASISVRTFNGKTARVNITVLPAPQSLTFDGDPRVLGAGEACTLSVKMNAGSAGTVTFHSSNESVLIVDAATGMVNAVAQGEADVVATAHNGVNTVQKICVKAAPSSIHLAQDAITIGVGEKVALPEVSLGEADEDCAGSYTLKASSTKYAQIFDGMIVGRRTGKTTVTVTSYNGRCAHLIVTVKRAPSKVTLNTSSLLLGVGEGHQLSATLSSKSAGNVSYTSANEAVASVTPEGYVTAAAPGTAVITAQSYNGKKATCTVEVRNAPESISLVPDNLTLGVGETRRLSATLNAGSAGSIHFESMDPAVASVNASGLLTALAIGETEIKVSAYNGATASCIVHVKAAPEGVSFCEETLILSAGDHYCLQEPEVQGTDAACSAFSYKSSKTKYATVSADGVITARRAGTAKITVQTYNGKSDTLTVTVKAAPKSISLSENTATLYIGLTLTPVVNFDNGVNGNYSLASADETVAAISADGRTITAISAGDTQITATSFNGKTAVMQLHVPPLPESVSVIGQKVMGVGEVYMLIPSLLPEEAGCKLEFSSSDPAVVSISENGEATACALGSAILTVRTMNGLSSACSVTVKAAPTALCLTPRNAMRCLDEQGLQLSVAFGAADQGGSVHYSSSDPAVATVSADGWVQFVGTGKVRITAESYNFHRGVCDLTIGERPSQMNLAEESISVALGDTVNVPVIFDQGCESYICSVEDPSIAAVSGESVTALACGTTILTATSRSGLSASCTLNVVEAPAGLTLEPTSAELILYAEPTLQLNAQVLPDGIGSVYYFSSDPAVATVDYFTGEVSAQSPGTCVIMAETYNGVHHAQCEITVHNLLHGVKIGIDPGHQRKGDKSTEENSPFNNKRKAKVSDGTAGKSTRVPEYVVNLQIGLKLRDELENYGAEVYMTRETHDVNISNRQRAEMMNELGVDMTLRIHLNGSSKSSKHGMSSWVRKTGPYKEESAQISELVLKYMSAETGAYNKGVKYSDEYTGQNWSTVPCLMLELGYMTNPREDRLLVTDDYQSKLVRGMVKGICEYMGRGDPYAEE